MATYPALLLVARGSHAGGYQGVVVLVDGPPTPDRLERDLERCGHSHRMTRTARACARRLARDLGYPTLSAAQLAAETRGRWDDWKHDD
jgi:hypothetical protein